jgi:hypothetical protein
MEGTIYKEKWTWLLKNALDFSEKKTAQCAALQMSIYNAGR